MRTVAIRGATTVERNTEGQITARSVELINEIAAANKLVSDNVISITISTTSDITASYPAKAIRESGILDAPLFSCLEPPIADALPLCIRVMLLAERDTDKRPVKHIYLHGARGLRRDLINEANEK